MIVRLPRVLIIDDDAEMRAMLRSMLHGAGFAVCTAEDGPSALTQIESGGFDLLVADILLPPPMDGIEIVRRARECFPTLRALFISGSEGPQSGDSALDDFVSKPFYPRELVGCICELWWRGNSSN